jgi:hypothetical protein
MTSFVLLGWGKSRSRDASPDDVKRRPETGVICDHDAGTLQPHRHRSLNIEQLEKGEWCEAHRMAEFHVLDASGVSWCLVGLLETVGPWRLVLQLCTRTSELNPTPWSANAPSYPDAMK